MQKELNFQIYENGDEFLEEDSKANDSTNKKSKEFIQEKYDYLEKFKIDDEKIKSSLIDSNNFISNVKELFCSFKSHLYKIISNEIHRKR
jgi:hypothetical protein